MLLSNIILCTLCVMRLYTVFSVLLYTSVVCFINEELHAAPMLTTVVSLK